MTTPVQATKAQTIGFFNREKYLFLKVALLFALLAYCVFSLQNIYQLGIYPDAINPDYLGIEMLHLSRSTIAWVLPGNFLWGHWPVLAGGLYHGSLHAYLEIPFILFGSDIISFNLSHVALGSALLLGLFLFSLRASDRLAVAVCMPLLMAADPAFVFAMRTQAYITTFPVLFDLLAMYVFIKEDGVSKPSWRYWMAGALLGFAFWGYFIHIFFLPGFILYTFMARGAKETNFGMKLCLLLVGFACGATLYVLGYFLLFKNMGLEGGVEWLAQAVAGLSQIEATKALSVTERIAYVAHLVRATITGEWHSAMIFGSVGNDMLAALKMSLLLGPTVLAIPLARGSDVLSRSFRLVCYCIASFLIIASIFGRGLGGHHFCALIPLFYAALGLAVGLIYRFLGEALQSCRPVLAATLAGALLFTNGAAFSQMNDKLSRNQAAKFYSRAVNDYPLVAGSKYSQSTHIFMSWGIVLPFVYLTGGKIAAYEPDRLDRSLCGDRPVRLVFAEDHAVESAKAALERLKLEGEIENYSPSDDVFQYVVVALKPMDRARCP